MAFKMAPKSPVLMKAMGYASPAKQSVKGTNQTIEAVGKPEGPALTALQQAQQDADAAQVSNQVANIVRNTSGTNKETARLKKRTARNNSATERKTKNAEKTQARVDEREKSGKTRVGKVVAKIKEAGSPAKQRTGGHRIKKKTLVKKLPELGNKNAEMGADGKMTIITANMAKNQKPIELKKMKHKKMKMEKVKLKNNPSR